MNNQEILIIVLIILLVVYRYTTVFFEKFETEPTKLMCKDYPLNSNCACPTDAPVQTISGTFPMNYGDNSPYTYKCVPTSTQEPPTNLWPNPK